MGFWEGFAADRAKVKDAVRQLQAALVERRFQRLTVVRFLEEIRPAVPGLAKA